MPKYAVLTFTLPLKPPGEVPLYRLSEQDNQLDNHALASASLALQELTNLNALEEDTEETAAIRNYLAQILSNHPCEVSALLKQAAASLGTEHESASGASKHVPYQIEDVTPEDVAPLSSIRSLHQTRQAERGVHNYRSQKEREVCGVSDRTEKVLTEHQQLAQQMNTILRLSDQARGPTQGVNRKVRWTEASNDSSAASKPNGNSANAEVAARGRAADISSSISFN
ncbi:hypothetical protein K435DRAFT_858410 [Dendrothele bispora CBS 962.96]|uniref:Uncharacterized protein n=1 Tax=Dendrothele bispora (strain CBS 962.96) TaxID=1314807 RepID=A0A4S8M491_DENBC|nr:hypothetical protein K435DRAFT_858410 [Dendrothele bispora CBS 962.96]